MFGVLPYEAGKHILQNRMSGIKARLVSVTHVSCPIKFYLLTGRRKQLLVTTVLPCKKNI